MAKQVFKFSLKTRFSEENSKIGKTININLPPPSVCQDMPCLNNGCYAMKAFRLYPSVRFSWMNNWELYSHNPARFFESIILNLYRRKKPVAYFRWHSAGEIPDQQYLNGMIYVATLFPKIKFLCFTKKYHFDFSDCPKNLQIVFSTWPGMDIPENIKDKCLAWVDNGKEERIASLGEKTTPCRLKCEKCRICWNLKKIDKHVIFKKH